MEEPEEPRGYSRRFDAVCKRQPVISHLLVGLLGIVAGAWLGALVFDASGPSRIALYKHAGAFRLACEAAGEEISNLRHVSIFLDDCTKPIVTPVLGQEGQLIVSRVVEGNTAADKSSRVTYSVKVDGRAADRWRILEVKRAPNQVILDASLLPTKAAAGPTQR